MEGELPLLLQLFLLRGDLAVPLDNYTLGKELLLSAASANFLQGVLRIVHEAFAERAESHLHNCAVVENLSLDVEVGDGLLQMGHERHIPSLVVIAVESEEVDMAQHGAGSDDALAVVEEVVGKNLDEVGGIGNRRLGCDG